MIPRPATTLLFAVLFAPGETVAAEQPSVAEQSLTQLKTAYHYTPPAAEKSATSPSPILAAPATIDAAAASAMPPIQLPAFTVVESMHVHDLDEAIKAAENKAEQKKFSVARSSELLGADIGKIRAGIWYEGASASEVKRSNHGGVFFNILKLQW